MKSVKTFLSQDCQVIVSEKNTLLIEGTVEYYMCALLFIFPFANWKWNMSNIFLFFCQLMIYSHVVKS